PGGVQQAGWGGDENANPSRRSVLRGFSRSREPSYAFKHNLAVSTPVNSILCKKRLPYLKDRITQDAFSVNHSRLCSPNDGCHSISLIYSFQLGSWRSLPETRASWRFNFQSTLISGSSNRIPASEAGS